MEGHRKARHQLIIVRGMTNAISDHGTKGHIAASQGFGKISPFSFIIIFLELPVQYFNSLQLVS